MDLASFSRDAHHGVGWPCLLKVLQRTQLCVWFPSPLKGADTFSLKETRSDVLQKANALWSEACPFLLLKQLLSWEELIGRKLQVLVDASVCL